MRGYELEGRITTKEKFPAKDVREAVMPCDNVMITMTYDVVNTVGRLVYYVIGPNKVTRAFC